MGESEHRIVIAIDGPAGAGKSTVARAVAARLGALYIDSGAMYRVVALAALRRGLEPADAARLGALAASIRIDLEDGRAFLDREDVSEAIRSPEATDLASRVSANPAVRRAMVARQREMAARGSAVMEGRDIGTVVFPDAELKIYLDADPAARAARRARELAEKGSPPRAGEVERQIAERDRRDRTRADSPLRPASDAVRIDTTDRSVEHIVETIIELARRCQSRKDSGG